VTHITATIVKLATKHFITLCKIIPFADLSIRRCGQLDRDSSGKQGI